MSDSAFAQETEVRISVNPSSNPVFVTVEGRQSASVRRWTFADSYGSASGLSTRIKRFATFDDAGLDVSAKQIGTGVYETPIACRRFRYEVDLTPPNVGSIAHVSWITAERGVLMLNDLLPRSFEHVAVRVVAPPDWRSASTDETGTDRFTVTQADQSVIMLGRDLRIKSVRIGGVDIRFVIEGEWSFTDEEALEIVTKLYKAYRKANGDLPSKRILIAVQPFPHQTRGQNWSAETRGTTLNYQTGKLLSRPAALTQLTTSLAHELLHLWVPNGLALDGTYDWFYEGFVEYQSLRVCVQLGVIGFHDYLNAVARAHDRYLTARQSGDFSLVEASKRRWVTTSQLVYSKGLLVAFVYDLTLRDKSANKRTMDDVFREVVEKYSRAPVRRDGNAAAIEVLDSLVGSTAFTNKYVGKSEKINLDESIEKFGFQVSRIGAQTRIAVVANPRSKSLSLHRKLGRSY